MKKLIHLIFALNIIFLAASCGEGANKENDQEEIIEPEMEKEVQEMEKELNTINEEIDSLTKSLEE